MPLESPRGRAAAISRRSSPPRSRRSIPARAGSRSPGDSEPPPRGPPRADRRRQGGGADGGRRRGRRPAAGSARCGHRDRGGMRGAAARSPGRRSAAIRSPMRAACRRPPSSCVGRSRPADRGVRARLISGGASSLLVATPPADHPRREDGDQSSAARLRRGHRRAQHGSQAPLGREGRRAPADGPRPRRSNADSLRRGRRRSRASIGSGPTVAGSDHLRGRARRVAEATISCRRFRRRSVRTARSRRARRSGGDGQAGRSASPRAPRRP